ncbi:MAG TPA: hypothetical protein VMR37_01635 [Rhabdochlamydiaceae bacterium]|jgi:hypothetical protein|nr:hypothetical protein [Rhabdochlamydiaceae bacterium]
MALGVNPNLIAPTFYCGRSADCFIVGGLAGLVALLAYRIIKNFIYFAPVKPPPQNSRGLGFAILRIDTKDLLPLEEIKGEIFIRFLYRGKLINTTGPCGDVSNFYKTDYDSPTRNGYLWYSLRMLSNGMSENLVELPYNLDLDVEVMHQDTVLATAPLKVQQMSICDLTRTGQDRQWHFKTQTLSPLSWSWKGDILDNKDPHHPFSIKILPTGEFTSPSTSAPKEENYFRIENLSNSIYVLFFGVKGCQHDSGYRGISIAIPPQTTRGLSKDFFVQAWEDKVPTGTPLRFFSLQAAVTYS